MYYHYSNKELIFDELLVREQEEHYKPKGVWLSYENEWLDWCEREGFSTCNLSTCNIYRTKLKYDNLYVIKTLDDLITLNKKYPAEYSIDWKKLSSDYEGIVFENYYSIKKELLPNFNFCQNNLTWFLGIDVNSACIWNPKNVVIEWNKVNRV